MARELAARVWVRHPETNEAHAFGPGAEDLPDWAADAIDSYAFAGEDDEPLPVGDTETADSTESDTGEDTDGDPDGATDGDSDDQQAPDTPAPAARRARR